MKICPPFQDQPVWVSSGELFESWGCNSLYVYSCLQVFWPQPVHPGSTFHLPASTFHLPASWWVTDNEPHSLFKGCSGGRAAGASVSWVMLCTGHAAAKRRGRGPRISPSLWVSPCSGSLCWLGENCWLQMCWWQGKQVPARREQLCGVTPATGLPHCCPAFLRQCHAFLGTLEMLKQRN